MLSVKALRRLMALPPLKRGAIHHLIKLRGPTIYPKIRGPMRSQYKRMIAHLICEYYGGTSKTTYTVESRRVLVACYYSGTPEYETVLYRKAWITLKYDLEYAARKIPLKSYLCKDYHVDRPNRLKHIMYGRKKLNYSGSMVGVFSRVVHTLYLLFEAHNIPGDIRKVIYKLVF